MLSDTTTKLKNQQQMSFDFSEAERQQQKQQTEKQNKYSEDFKKLLEKINKSLVPLKEIAKPTGGATRSFRAGQVVGGVRKRVQGVKDVFKTDRADKDKNLFQLGGGALKKQANTFIGIVFGDLLAQFDMLKNVVKTIGTYARATINTFKDAGRLLMKIPFISKRIKKIGEKIPFLKKMGGKKSGGTDEQLSFDYAGGDGTGTTKKKKSKPSQSGIKGEEQQREGSLWRKAVIFYLRSINKKLKKLLKMGLGKGKDGGLLGGLGGGLGGLLGQLAMMLMPGSLLRFAGRAAGLGIARRVLGAPLRAKRLRNSRFGRFARRFRPGKKPSWRPFSATSRDRLRRLKNSKRPGLFGRMFGRKPVPAGAATKLPLMQRAGLGVRGILAGAGTKAGGILNAVKGSRFAAPLLALGAGGLGGLASKMPALGGVGRGLGTVGRGLGTAAKFGGRVLAPLAGAASLGMGAFRGAESIKGLLSGDMNTGQALANFVAGIGLVNPGDLNARKAKTLSGEGVLGVRDATNAIVSGRIFNQPLSASLSGAKEETKEEKKTREASRDDKAKTRFMQAWKDDLPKWFKASMVPNSWVDGSRKRGVTEEEVTNHVNKIRKIAKEKHNKTLSGMRTGAEKETSTVGAEQMSSGVAQVREQGTQALQNQTLQEQIKDQSMKENLAGGGTNIVNSNNTTVIGGGGGGGDEGFGSLSDPTRHADSSYTTLLQKSMVHPMA
jgi:hypothetical protein